MKNSTSKSKFQNAAINILSITFWILVWQIISMTVNQEILLVSPFAALSRFLQIMGEKSFWKTVFFSFSKIVSGFFLAMTAGVLFAAASAKSRIIHALIKPVNQVIKSTPIASFIILVLLWIKSANVSVIISFLIVFPLFYSNTLSGINSLDIKLNQMAEIYHISLKNRLLYIYAPQITPYIISASSVGLGMCWKAGIAAEVIATPKGSMGDALYRAKINLDTPSLFAWTAAIILISLLFEKLFLYVVRTCSKSFE